MFRRRFNDLPLAWKLLFFPAVSALLAAIMLGGAVHWTRSNADALGALDRDVFEPLHAAHRLEVGVTLAHAELAALLLKRVIEADSKAWDRSAAAIAPVLAEQAEAAARLRDMLHGRVPGALVAQLDRTLEAYLADAKATIAMAATDAAFGTILMLQADLHFSELRDTLEALVETLSLRRRTLADEAIAHGSGAVRLLAGLAFASTLLTLLTLLGSVLLPARAITRPLRQLSADLARPAGDTAATMPGLDRRDEIGDLARAVDASRRNATMLLRREAELTEINERFDMALANMSHGLCLVDAQERLLVANRRFSEVLGLPSDDVRAGMTLREVTGLQAAHGGFLGRSAGQAYAELRTRLTGGPAGNAVEELGDDRAIAISWQAMPAGGWVLTFEDISARRAAEARIAHLAHHDALTDLPNRVLFRRHLEEALPRARRGHGFAVFCLDLDRFKEVNDTLGHSAGDALLRAVTGRLAAALHETDILARLGGDEFAVITTEAATPEAATAMARRLAEALEAPFDLGGHPALIGASLGIACAPTDGADPDALLKAADLALHRAKADGRGCWRFFEPGMDARMQQRRAAELDIRRALAAGEFELFYQPILALPSREVCSFEALLRWRHPERGLVPPDQFIPLAEETGLIVQLGAWALARACAEAAGWPAPLKVAVNLSPMQFASPGLVEAVAAALAGSGLMPDRLELEITETVMLQDSEATMAMLRRLKEIGVRIAMDDFGTGYSSLGYLQRFPFDKVKIDRSFVRGLGLSRQSDMIVRAVTNLCDGLGMTTTAEGVETEAQLEALCRKGCREAQGYLFSKPRPAGEVPALIASLRPPAAGAAQAA